MEPLELIALFLKTSRPLSNKMPGPIIPIFRSMSSHARSSCVSSAGAGVTTYLG